MSSLIDNFVEYKDELISLADETYGNIKKSAECLGIQPSSVATEVKEKLRANKFEIVLIGAFQSGKSTLFSYLCGGRELSPVGPGGGGIRTSGCQVSATAVPEGSPEYAEVSWRSKNDLVASLSGELIELDLDDIHQRHELKEKAWKRLNDNNCQIDEKELLRFALVMAHFYDDPELKRIKSKTRFDDISEAYQYSSYPQSWEKKWGYIMSSQDKTLSDLSVNEILFAFMAKTDFFVDSQDLRIMDCVITDCPGLFISAWDTQIAEKCIKKADAILYLFEGGKAMTKSDLDALKTCLYFSSSDQILFGSNLRIALSNWKRIEDEQIIPTLRQNNFPSMTEGIIHPLHCGIGLRSKELSACKKGSLTPETEQSIDIDIRLNRDDPSFVPNNDNRLSHLHRLLKRYISDLEHPKLEELPSLENLDEALFQTLDEISALPQFRDSAREYVVSKKSRSLLITQGITPIIQQVEDIHKQLADAISLASQNIEQTETHFKAKEDALNKFNEEIQFSRENIQTRIHKVKDELSKNLKTTLENNLRLKEKECVKIIKDNLSGAILAKAKQIGNNLAKKMHIQHAFTTPAFTAQKVGQEISTLIDGVISSTLLNITEEIPNKNDVKNVATTVEKEWHRLRDISNAMPELNNILSVQPPLPSTRDIPQEIKSQTFQHTLTIINESLNWTWLNWILFGANKLIINQQKWAEDIYNEFAPSLNNEVIKTIAQRFNNSVEAHYAKNLELFDQATNKPQEDFLKEKEIAEILFSKTKKDQESAIVRYKSEMENLTEFFEKLNSFKKKMEYQLPPA